MGRAGEGGKRCLVIAVHKVDTAFQWTHTHAIVTVASKYTAERRAIARQLRGSCRLLQLQIKNNNLHPSKMSVTRLRRKTIRPSLGC